MPQHDQVINDGNGATVRSDINAALAAIFSSSSGTEPTVKVAGMLWFDTSISGTNVLKMRDQTNSSWITISGPILDLIANSLTATTTAATDPVITANKPSSGQASSFRGQMAGITRWIMRLGNTTAESAPQTGSDFELRRYDNSGVYIDSPMMITRAAGLATIPGLTRSYAFAHRSGSGAFSLNPGAAFVKVNLTVLGLNGGGAWSLVSNSLNVPKAGVYMVGVSGIIATPASAGSGHFLVSIGVNGTLASQGAARVYNSIATPSVQYTLNAQRPLSLAANDKLDLLGWAPTTGATMNDGANETYLWAYELSAA